MEAAADSDDRAGSLLFDLKKKKPKTFCSGDGFKAAKHQMDVWKQS